MEVTGHEYQAGAIAPRKPSRLRVRLILCALSFLGLAGTAAVLMTPTPGAALDPARPPPGESRDRFRRRRHGPSLSNRCNAPGRGRRDPAKGSPRATIRLRRAKEGEKRGIVVKWNRVDSVEDTLSVQEDVSFRKRMESV